MRAKTCQEIAEQFHTFVKQQLPTKLLMEAIYIYAVFISVIIVIFVIIEATACMFTCLFVYICVTVNTHFSVKEEVRMSTALNATNI